MSKKQPGALKLQPPQNISTLALFASAIIVAIAGTYLVTKSFAASPNLGSQYATTGSITLKASSANPKFGDHVLFDYAVNGKLPGNSVADISIDCSQGGVEKYLFVDPAAQPLDPGFGWPIGGIGTSWPTSNGQPISCTAKLFYYWTKGQSSGRQDLASTTFSATP